MGNWSKLPDDLLEKISDLCFLNDCIRMAAVCKSWLLFMKKRVWFGRQLPWLMMLPDSTKEKDAIFMSDSRDFFDPREQKIYTICFPDLRGKRCAGSFKNGWLVIEDDVGEMSLFNPWSRHKISLPHKSTFKLFGRGKVVRIMRAALSDDLSIIFVLYGVNYFGYFLAFSSLVGDDVWHLFKDPKLGVPYQDVVHFKGKFYGLGVGGDIFLLKTSRTPSVKWLVHDFLPDSCRHVYTTNLVPDLSTNSMFLVVRWMTRETQLKGSQPIYFPRITTVHFDVYQFFIEEEGEKLSKRIKVDSLGDRAIFLGINSPFIVMASEFPGFKGNRIYYADNYLESYFHLENPTGHRDLGVFNMEDGTIEPLLPNRFHPTPLSCPLWIAITPSTP